MTQGQIYTPKKFRMLKLQPQKMRLPTQAGYTQVLTVTVTVANQLTGNDLFNSSVVDLRQYVHTLIILCTQPSMLIIISK